MEHAFEALNKLLKSSIDMCKVEVPGKVLVAIDCRTTLASNYCWGQEGLSCARYSGTFNIFCLLYPYLRAAAASLLSLKAQGADLEVITSVKRPPGIAEVRCCENQCVNWDEKTACCSGWPWHWYCRPDR